MNYADQLKIATANPEEFLAVSGRGLKCMVPRWQQSASVPNSELSSNRVSVFIGNRAWLLENNIMIPRAAHIQLMQMENKGRTGLLLAVDGQLTALLGIADEIKPESKLVIHCLESMGLEVWMATGDNPRTAAHIASELGITHVLAGVAPAGKHEQIKKLQVRCSTNRLIECDLKKELLE